MRVAPKKDAPSGSRVGALENAHAPYSNFPWVPRSVTGWGSHYGVQRGELRFASQLRENLAMAYAFHKDSPSRRGSQSRRMTPADPPCGVSSGPNEFAPNIKVSRHTRWKGSSMDASDELLPHACADPSRGRI